MSFECFCHLAPCGHQVVTSLNDTLGGILSKTCKTAYGWESLQHLGSRKGPLSHTPCPATPPPSKAHLGDTLYPHLCFPCPSARHAHWMAWAAYGASNGTTCTWGPTSGPVALAVPTPIPGSVANPTRASCHPSSPPPSLSQRATPSCGPGPLQTVGLEKHLLYPLKKVVLNELHELEIWWPFYWSRAQPCSYLRLRNWKPH